MNESEYIILRETAWRRPLNAEEKVRLQSYLLVHPDAQPDWEAESLLNQALVNLPDAPLSSNFTARVLQAVALEDLRAARSSRGWLTNVRLWLPRFAVAGLVLGLGGLGYERYHLHQLHERADSLKIVTQLATTVPDVRMWQDFDAIASLDQVAPSRDQVLWNALTTD